ncbi:MAG: hypothetical protein ACQES2_11165 [Pseudomonadota bacterium]
MNKKYLKKAACAFLLMALGGQVYAVAPANSTLRNTAELTYTGLATPIQASVDVTVNLTPASATQSAPADNTAAENQSTTFTYTLTSNSNGPDVYDLSANNTLNNVSGTSAATFSQGGVGVTSVTLGASAASATANAGTNTITVPSDGTTGSDVNNLEAGDTVVIGGNVYTIASVNDNGTTAAIALTTNLTTVVSPGEPILEQQDFDVTLSDVGSVTTSGTPASVDIDVTATSQADPGLTTTDSVTVNVTELAFEKLVTNETTVNGGSPVGIDFDGDTVDDQDFYTTASGVTAESGDTLRYAIRVTAPAATTLTGVEFSDVLPAFTTYVAGSTELNGAAVSDDPGPASPLIGGMSVNSPGEPSGTVNPGESAVVTFRVTVD